MGTMVMASRRNWPILNVVSYAFVLGTFASWADSYYTPAQWVPTQVFLTIFGALFTGAGLRAQRAGTGSAGMVGVLLVTAPIIFHVASVANLQPHWLALLLYLTLASVAGVAASIKLDSAWLRLAVFAFVAPVLWQWIGEHAGPGWLLAPAAVALAIYAMNLVAIGERLARQAGRWLKADLVLFHGSALGLFAGLYAIFDPVATSSMPLLALALAAWHGGLTWFWRGTSEEAGLNSLAVAFAMLGFAIGLQFDVWWSVVGWAIEAAAIVWVGLKSRRDWMRLGGALLLAWAVLLLVRLGFFEAPAGFSPVFNARVGATLAVVAVCFVLALLHQRYAGHVPDRAGPEIAALYLVGNVLTIVLLTTEISFYWQMREATDATARLARSASVSVAWAVYGTAAHRRRHRPQIRAHPLPGHRAAGDDHRQGVRLRPVDARRHLPDHRLRRPRRVPAPRCVALSAVQGRHHRGREGGRRQKSEDRRQKPDRRNRQAQLVVPLDSDNRLVSTSGF